MIKKIIFNLSVLFLFQVHVKADSLIDDVIKSYPRDTFYIKYNHYRKIDKRFYVKFPGGYGFAKTLREAIREALFASIKFSIFLKTPEGKSYYQDTSNSEKYEIFMKIAYPKAMEEFSKIEPLFKWKDLGDFSEMDWLKIDRFFIEFAKLTEQSIEKNLYQLTFKVADGKIEANLEVFHPFAIYGSIVDFDQSKKICENSFEEVMEKLFLPERAQLRESIKKINFSLVKGNEPIKNLQLRSMLMNKIQIKSNSLVEKCLLKIMSIPHAEQTIENSLPQ